MEQLSGLLLSAEQSTVQASSCYRNRIQGSTKPLSGLTYITLEFRRNTLSQTGTNLIDGGTGTTKVPESSKISFNYVVSYNRSVAVTTVSINFQ